ncbi:signal transducer and activator of transcription 5B-like isoform X1 [Hypanus sabinus]|uniref:signal transducer and activator of transcription 5B-like isoform X1 n=1 Tax=Hypanus sabinus TaxID=79690 RepID=UPI0028C48129|nr:signal transducer and activator of transcription 5B-like isoform X1 [Hypanus sabinus]XP_059812314.1 signal transducer and activator of transcription 5B-like isoform X1 [Hypanus sabinus]XP_059812315.1 signal transducer and activator of transcription 5B-like isoform X1 [Hypanus sabinus]
MAFWSEIMKHQQFLPRFQELYEKHFPIEVRHYLAEWIEQQPWSSINRNPSHESLARNLLDTMVSELRKVANHMSYPVNCKLNEYAAYFKNMFDHQPLEFVNTMNYLLMQENTLFQELQQSSVNIGLPNPLPAQTFPTTSSERMKQDDANVVQQLTLLNNLIKNIQMYRSAIQQINESVEREQQQPSRCFQTQPHLPQANSPLPEFTKQEERIKQQKSTRDDHRRERNYSILEAVRSLEQAQGLVLTMIQDWKRRLQLSGNGAYFEDNLGSLQEWCDKLAEMNCQIQQEFGLISSQEDVAIDQISGVPEKLSSLLNNLVRSAFLVEKQPPQVLKTQSKFSSTVRFLLGVRLNAQAKPPLVKAIIITEQQARVMRQHGNIQSENTGEIMNSTSLLEFSNATKTTSASFRNMSLKKIKRSDRRGTESVTEEKFAVLFSSELCIAGSEVKYHVQALSLPIVVIVHGSQDNNATATILWDNAFSEIERLPFYVPDRVSWSQMCDTLNMKFMAEVQSTQGLCKQHFVFLAQKIFDEQSFSMEEFTNRMVSWTQFNKENLPGRTFTFWQWFDGVMELTKKHLKDYWNNGLILGFVSKQYALRLLNQQVNGTFLLRFSDSEIGGITIAWIDNSDKGGRQVFNVQPFTTKDLTIRSLGDRVRDIERLLYLFPSRPKDETFKKYYTKEAKGKDGYLHAGVKTTVNGEQTQMVVPTMLPSPVAQPSGVCSTPDISRWPQLPCNPSNINYEKGDTPVAPPIPLSPDIMIAINQDEDFPNAIPGSHLINPFQSGSNMEVNNYYEGDHQFVRSAENLPTPSDLELSALLNINPMDIVNTSEF